MQVFKLSLLKAKPLLLGPAKGIARSPLAKRCPSVQSILSLSPMPNPGWVPH